MVDNDTKTRQLNIRATKEDREAFDKIAQTLGRDYKMADVVRQFAQNNRHKTREELLRLINGTVASLSPLIIPVPIIGGAICGPLSSARADNDAVFSLSDDIAKELGYVEGDMWIEAHGQSMEGAGIVDGALVLMRPLPPGRTPRRGEIALVQIFSHDGDCLSTIKRWERAQPEIKLLDGDDNEYSMPKDAEKIEAVATAQGVIAKL